MNKEEKAASVKQISERLGESDAVFAVDYRGISVPQVSQLRTKLREADANFNVVKNRLAKRAADDAGTEGLEELLVGPTALTYVRGDAVLAAKAISDFIAEHKILEYKGGVMDGQPLDAEGFKAMAKLPGVDVMRGRLVGMIASPLTGLARGLGGLTAGLAVALGQIAEQGLIGGDTPAEPEAAEPEAADEPAPEAAPEAAPEEAEAEASSESTDEPQADASADGADAPDAETENETEPEAGSDDAADAGEAQGADDGDDDKENN